MSPAKNEHLHRRENLDYEVSNFTLKSSFRQIYTIFTHKVKTELGGLGNQEKLKCRGDGGSFNWLCDLLGHFS
jgi:hypothetical protein